MSERRIHPFDLPPDDYERVRKAGLGWVTEGELAKLRPTLAPGDRFALTPNGRNAARPRGTQAGVIVADKGDCWEVRYDGCKSTRWLFKAYAVPEPVDVEAAA